MLKPGGNPFIIESLCDWPQHDYPEHIMDFEIKSNFNYTFELKEFIHNTSKLPSLDGFKQRSLKPVFDFEVFIDEISKNKFKCNEDECKNKQFVIRQNNIFKGSC